MGRVRGELPHLVLRPQPRAESLLDAVEHRVDRGGESAGLLAAAGVGHPRREVTAAGDHVGGARHPVKRSEAAADQPASADGEQGEQHPPGDQLRQHKAADMAAHVAHWAADKDDGRAWRRDAGGRQGDGNRPPGDAQCWRAVRREVERLVAGGQPSHVREHAAGRLAGHPVEQRLQFGRDRRARRELTRGAGSQRQVSGGEAVSSLGDLPDRLPGREPELGVELVLLEPAEHHRAHHAHHHEEHRGQRDQADQQPGAQRQRPAPPPRRGHGGRRL